MAILAFQKPDKVIMLEADDFVGKFEFRPLEGGFGTTLVMLFAAFSSRLWTVTQSTPSPSKELSMSLLPFRASRRMSPTLFST